MEILVEGKILDKFPRNEHGIIIQAVVWLLALILLPFLGAVLYWFIGREQKVGDEERERPLE